MRTLDFTYKQELRHPIIGVNLVFCSIIHGFGKQNPSFCGRYHQK
jgi:hypothetical protein